MATSQKDPPTPLEIDAAVERGRAVREMFSAIAPRYDLLNHLLSLNIDRSWRRRAVDRLGWESLPRGRYLDLCSGTFDLALELAQRPSFSGQVVALDFAKPMLIQGLGKITKLPIQPVCADALKIPCPPDCFDGAMVAFGVRNLSDIDSGLRELGRVLRPGARLVILDFATPPGRFYRRLYGLYFTRLLPFVGRLISKHSFAYNYLPESVSSFAAPAQLGDRMKAAGYTKVEWDLLTGGIACLWHGKAGGEGN